jgi:class 3 adenylate cyclase/tetratricopeptide (TPR) repeat protein
MECPNCQTENPDTRKFCRECGDKFLLICSQCNAENIPGDKFCGECGHSLTQTIEQPIKELSFDDKLKKIQSYLPTGLTDKILAQRGKIEGERKQVTVMFCDLEGFTGISEKFGPEKMYDIMDQIYEILIHKVQDYEGTVNEMTGDGIMALFGAPIALEDAPQRAIRSGMAIHREMTKLSDKYKDENIPPLKMRIGIHTGPVVVGSLGNDLRVEFKAVGETVNLASRMEGLAEPGTTYVTEDTFKITEGLFRFEALGDKEIKGKKAPVKVYRVVFTSSRRTRFDVSAERGLSPFVGRNRELELLMDGFERSKTGRGQAFSVMSEAGVGKSRLLYEFRKSISNEDVTFLEGKCLSYSRSIAYHPVVDILKSNFNILDSDDCNQIRDKVVHWLKAIDVHEANILPYLLELLSVKDSGIDQIDISPEAKKHSIISAINLITLKGSEIRPLILAIEDLHWIDKSSEEIFKYLLESISGAKVFLIFTYRPEYVHTWGGKSYHSQINLNRLSNRESLVMVSHLLGTAEIDREIEELVLEKTEGVPFFIEEFLKSLIDLKIIESSKKQYHLVKDIKNISIPSTIHEIIMARVDSLPESAKELLQIGSAIDREFSFKLIQNVSDLAESELLSHLSILKDTELIYERGIYPQSTYIFKHALTQEVVYESILGSRKKKLHDKIGRAIEELYKNNIDEHYEVLSDHFMKSEYFEKGEQYCELICKKAVKKVSFNDAITYGKKRIECLEKLPRSDDVQKKIIDTRSLLGLYLLQLLYYIEAKEAIEPVIDLALKHDYKKRLCQIHSIEGNYLFWIKEDLPNSFKILKIALRDSEEAGDHISLIMAHSFLGATMGLNCEFGNALESLQAWMDIVKKTESKWGMALVKSLQSYFVFNFKGEIDLAHKTSSEAIQLAEESGDILSKTYAYICHGRSCYQKMLLRDAEKFFAKGLNCCERINILMWKALSQWTLGDVYYELGDYAKAKNCYLETVLLLNKTQVLPSLMNLNKVAATRSMVMNNEKGVDLESIYNYVSGNKIKAFEGWIHRYLGEILLNIDDNHLIEAEEWIRQAIEADKRNSTMFSLAKDYALYADLFKRKDDIPKAKETLSKTIEIYKKCGADGWVEKYEKELTTL